jgi:hypothetical protein
MREERLRVEDRVTSACLPLFPPERLRRETGKQERDKEETKTRPLRGEGVGEDTWVRERSVAGSREEA